MTRPRQVLRGTTYHVTHRCLNQQFLLTPSPVVNEVFLYVLGVAAQRYDIQMHAFCVLSNHYHLVLTDPSANLPAFQQFLDSMVGRALNAYFGRRDYFWQSGSYCAVALLDAGAIVDKTVYTLANPVTSRLVQSARQWPGHWSAPESMGAGPRRVGRSDVFFDPKGSMPESVELELTVPAGFESPEAFREQVAAGLAEREAQLRTAGSGYVGLVKLRAQRPTDVPRAKPPERRIRPRVAARSTWRRIEALVGLKAFLQEHLEALASWRSGRREVAFPAGTYLMRVAHGAACAEYG